MDLNKLLTYILLFFCLHISGQGLLIEQDGQLIRWDEPRYRAVDSLSIKYGYLYNWYVTDSIANTTGGWRVPDDNDWTVLTDYLGADAGSKLAGSYDLWASGALRDNDNFDETGFNGLPGGNRGSNGAFTSIGDHGYWWSATENSATAGWNRIIFSGNSSVFKTFNNKKLGFSVRTMRDTITGETHGDTITEAYTGNDGKKYDAVVIGTQVWITANLAETKYNNGETIQEVTDNTAWTELTAGARCSYNNIESNALELGEEAGLYAESRPDLIKFDFDVPAHSSLYFPSDTTHMAGSFVNDTFRIAKWYDYIKRDSLVQADLALQPWFDFDDGSVRFDGGQVLQGQLLGFVGVAEKYTIAVYVNSVALAVNQVILKHNDGANDRVMTYHNNINRVGLTHLFDGTLYNVNKGYNDNEYYSLIASGNGIPSQPQAYFNLEKIVGGAGVSGAAFNGFLVGARHTDASEPLTGNIRTIVLFDTELNKAQRILTNKYLSK